MISMQAGINVGCFSSFMSFAYHQTGMQHVLDLYDGPWEAECAGDKVG